jgi:hypothetical protein
MFVSVVAENEAGLRLDSEASLVKEETRSKEE